MYYFQGVFKFLFKWGKLKHNGSTRTSRPTPTANFTSKGRHFDFLPGWVFDGGKENIRKVENFLITDTFLQEQFDVHLQQNEQNVQQ